MDKEDLQPSNKPVADYELERIREEQILDGWRGAHADAPVPSGSGGSKPSGRWIKPLD